MMVKKRKTRLYAFSSIFRLQASVFLQTRRAGSILPLTSLKGLEDHKVSWSDTGFDFIKTALQNINAACLHTQNRTHFYETCCVTFRLVKGKISSRRMDNINGS